MTKIAQEKMLAVVPQGKHTTTRTATASLPERLKRPNSDGFGVTGIHY